MNIAAVLARALAEAGAIFVASIVRQTVQNLKVASAADPNHVDPAKAAGVNPLTGQQAGDHPSTGQGLAGHPPAATAPAATAGYRPPER